MCVRLRVYQVIIVLNWKRIWSSPIPFWLLDMLHGREAVETKLHRSPEYSRLYESLVESRQQMKDRLFGNGEKFVLLPNDFPYHLEDGVKHYVLWINPNTTLPVKRALFVIDELLINLGYENPCKRVFFKNSQSIKSIRDIDHIHVFVQAHGRATPNHSSNSEETSQASMF